MSSKQPLDAEQIWRLWTRDYPAWLMRAGVRVPSEARRVEHFARIFGIPHELGIPAHYDFSFRLNQTDTQRVWEIMLGKFGYYSGVDFDPSCFEMTLQEATGLKDRTYYRLLDVAGSPTAKVIDLGCGWGASLKAL